MVEPIKIVDINERKLLCDKIPNAKNPNPKIVAIPAVIPSILSKKLRAFIKPTIQSNNMGRVI